MTSHTERAVETLAEAHQEGLRVRPVGASTWSGAWGLDGNLPGPPDRTIELLGCSEVIAYEPADLTMTVGAGATLEQIAELTRPNAQWLAVDPIGDPGATIGATVATGSSGGLRSGFSGIRDHVLGATVVTGDGRRLELGGRVVKNVAGFDLLKLMVGGWGRFGVVTEVSVRLHPLPACDLTVVYESDDLRHLVWVGRTLATAPVVPAALRLDIGPKGMRLAARVVGGAASAPEELRVLESAASKHGAPQHHIEGEASAGFWREQTIPPDHAATECALFANPRELATMHDPMLTAHNSGWRIRCDVMDGLCSLDGVGVTAESLSSWVDAGASLRVHRADPQGRVQFAGLQKPADPTVERLVGRLVHAFDPSGVLG